MVTDHDAKPREINEVLSEITGALVGQFDMPRLLHQVVSTSRRILSAEVCSIFLEDRVKEPGVIAMVAGSGFAEPLIRKAKYQIGEGFTGYVAMHGRKFNIRTRRELETLEVDGRRIWLGKHDHSQWPSGKSEFRNLIALPLRIKDHILGVIKVENKDLTAGPHFSEEDEKYFETIANVVALAIENARLHEQLEKQLKAIAAKASHRIGNQVANFDGIELDLEDEETKPVPDRQAISEIRKRIASTTKSLKRMIEEFQTYGKPLSLERKPTDINEVIRNEIWYARPPNAISIAQNLSAAIPFVDADPGRFGEAIKELLRNSLRALTDAGGAGSILVTTTLGPLDTVLVRVEDSGPGFPPNFPIFEPFQARRTDSTGLGLATVKELVEAHGGAIRSVFSTNLGGACIEFDIPITPRR